MIASSMTAIAASAPVLLRHAGSNDWTDMTLGLIVGLSLGIAAAFLVVAMVRLRNAS